jgi:GNAT superfamily N-acetyltransferase
MTITTPRRTWSVVPEPVDSAEAQALLRDYLIDVADRYYLLHLGRGGTPEEIETGLAESSSDDLVLVPPTGVFLLGRYGEEAAGCAGLRVRDEHTVELTRVFVQHDVRGTGGGAQLLAAADRAARDLGADRIVLDTRLDLIEARTLYLKIPRTRPTNTPRSSTPAPSKPIVGPLFPGMSPFIGPLSPAPRHQPRACQANGVTTERHRLYPADITQEGAGGRTRPTDFSLRLAGQRLNLPLRLAVWGSTYRRDWPVRRPTYGASIR